MSTPQNMAHLHRAQGHLEAADLVMRAGDLVAFCSQVESALQALSELALRGEMVQMSGPPQVAWAAEPMASAVWQLLARLHNAGCHVFPVAGTLLGFERDGQLLPNDKDADFGVWLDDFNLTVRAMSAMGLQRLRDVPPFDNMACMLEPQSGLTIDVFGIRREPEHHRLVGGTWLYGKPASHQRLSIYPWFTLTQRAGPAGPVWWPADPEALLTAVYGDWRTPQPEWNTHVSSHAVHELNLHWRCFALKNLATCWLTQDAPRTRRLLDQISARAGWDAQLMHYRDALDTLLASPTRRGAA